MTARLRPLSLSTLPSLPRCDRCGVPGTVRSAARAAQAAWGLVGCGVYADGVCVGYLLVRPEADVARIIAAHVIEAERGRGLGRDLVRGTAARLVRRVAAIEAVASPTGQRHTCAQPPAQWLTRVGFEPRGERMRLDLDATVRWRPDLQRALAWVSGLVRPAPPQPAASLGCDQSRSSRNTGISRSVFSA